jgi:plastocyanin
MLLRFTVVAACIAPLWAAAASGTVTGTVVIERKLTKRKVTPAAELYQRGTPVGLEPNETDPLAWERSHVAIYLEGTPSSSPATSSAVLTMSQDHRRFVPDLLVIPAGSTVSFPNLDPIFHNVFSLSKPKSFDLGNYPQGQSRKVTFNTPGIVFVNCHLHANMAAAVVIAPNRWNTRVDDAGKFALADVPPGTYTIVAWHKTAGFFRKQITVREAGSQNVEFSIPLMAPESYPRENAAAGH